MSCACCTQPVFTGSTVALALLFVASQDQNWELKGAVSMAAQHHSQDDTLRRVQGEYIEMPGLRLTTAQAQRLWGLDRAACDALLGALVDAKFLFRTRDGAFVRSEYTTGRKDVTRVSTYPASR
jgi:hypothetical protein